MPVISGCGCGPVDVELHIYCPLSFSLFVCAHF